MKANKLFSALMLPALIGFNAIRTIEGKMQAWKDKKGIHNSDYSGGGSYSNGSKRGKGMKEYHRQRMNMNGRDHNSFGTFSRIKPVYGIKLSWELK